MLRTSLVGCLPAALAPLLGAVPALGAQGTWTPRRGAVQPVRSYGYLAYDANRDRVVRFGGWDGTAQNGTWEWDGQTWLRRRPLWSPAARAFHGGLVYDPLRKETLVFGGSTNRGAVYSDTWRWDGNVWRLGAAGPPARSRHALAFDGKRGQMILFGGADPKGNPLADTWTWNGTSWTQRRPRTSPPPLMMHSMAYDATRGRVVLFGGYDINASKALAATWEWDGTSWSQVRPRTSPPPRALFAMYYDAARRRVTAFGGFTHERAKWLGDLWEYDGTSWTRQSFTSGPTPRCCPGVAYDAQRDLTVLFGGCDDFIRGDTWELCRGGGARVWKFGDGCRGAGGVPALGAAFGSFPWLGARLHLVATSLPRTPGATLALLGTSRSFWGSVALPFDLAKARMPGCGLLVAPSVWLAATRSSGRATFAIDVPNLPALAGERFYAQCFAADATANAAGWITSNANEYRIGRN